jgi:ribosome maturation factor RimP
MRAQSEIETRILGMIEPTAKGLGLDIVRVRVMGGHRPTLQVMTERPDGTVSVEDCARLSRRISPLLDEQDPIAGEYSLEVSSPGIDRPLTRAGDFGKWIGHEARVELGVPTADGRKRFNGVIAGETPEGMVALTLKDGGTASLALADMAKASLVLTDALIDAVQAGGLAPAELEDEEFEDDFDEVVEIDDDADETDDTDDDEETDRE